MMTREIQPLREAEITRQIARAHFDAFDRMIESDVITSGDSLVSMVGVGIVGM
jgi:ribulose 1,5-bisphosphate synthetase/thiazole synthase